MFFLPFVILFIPFFTLKKQEKKVGFQGGALKEK